MSAAEIASLPNFWATLHNAEHRLLALDYDGTLAPFRVDRMRAIPSPGVVDALDRIRLDPRNHVAIVSGRPLEDLQRLLPVQGVTWVGSHGFEGQRLDGSRWTHSLSPAQREGLRQARLCVSAMGHDARLEPKSSTLAFHTRGLETAVAKSLQAAVTSGWSPLCDDGALRMHAFDGGVELRVTGVDKGTALRDLLKAADVDACVVYVGDDATDEDAFAVALEKGGFGIRVGGVERPSYAGGRLPDCAAVLDLLRRWPVEGEPSEAKVEERTHAR